MYGATRLSKLGTLKAMNNKDNREQIMTLFDLTDFQQR